jgi:phage FluMu protein Com
MTECPYCGTKFEVIASKKRGRSYKCPRCKEVMEVKVIELEDGYITHIAEICGCGHGEHDTRSRTGSPQSLPRPCKICGVMVEE